ncbi:MAG: LysM peptidoglycan-binding domain-containing protein, partial [Candidatus Woesebacteria bacterium]|nr:LysM peptidoglycan-binding domain-containing protein [Candidatus Woesebacteria bacterium]
MNFDLKKFLKKIKLNEETISMVLGAIVIVIVGVLIVNYFKDKSVGTIPGTSSQTSTKEHIVVKGDTLWSIAEDSFGSGYNWVDLKSENSLKTDTIEIGQKLTIT